MIQFDKLTREAASVATQAVDIVALVGAQEIPAALFGTRYTLSPAPGDEQAYATLRETLQRTRRIGIVYVVLGSRPQLAAILPRGEALVLTTLLCGTDASEVFEDETGIALKRWLPEAQDAEDALFEDVLQRSRRGHRTQLRHRLSHGRDVRRPWRGRA